MGKIKAAGIRELKNHLSAYLREVRSGTTVLVLDRGEVIGELRRPREEEIVAMPQDNPLVAAWLRAGVITMPITREHSYPPSPLSSPPGTAQRLLDEDRGV